MTKNISLRRKQTGIATLAVSLVVLLAATIMTTSASKVGVTEQRVAANYVRARQAFDGAQAGLEFAFSYLGDVGQQGTVKATLEAGDTPPPLTGALPNGASYTVTVALPPGVVPAPDAAEMLLVQSTGASPGNAGASQTVQQLVSFSALTSGEQGPLTTLGEATILATSATDITSRCGEAAVWSGGDVLSKCCRISLGPLLDGLLGPLLLNRINAILGGVFNPTISGTGTDASVPAIDANSDTLAEKTGDEFFADNFNNRTKEQVRESCVDSEWFAERLGIDAVDLKLTLIDFSTVTAPCVWLDGDLLNVDVEAGVLRDTPIGSPDKKLKIIIDGEGINGEPALLPLNLNALAATDIYADIYVIGDAALVTAGLDSDSIIETVTNALNTAGIPGLLLGRVVSAVLGILDPLLNGPLFNELDSRLDMNFYGSLKVEGDLLMAGAGANIGDLPPGADTSQCGKTEGTIPVPVPGSWTTVSNL